MNSWEVIWEEEVVEEDLKKIDKTTARKIRDKVREVLPKDPKMGKLLTDDWKGCRRITFGKYRIIYEIYENVLLVLVVKVGPRKNVYEGGGRYSMFSKK